MLMKSPVPVLIAACLGALLALSGSPAAFGQAKSRRKPSSRPANQVAVTLPPVGPNEVRESYLEDQDLTVVKAFTSLGDESDWVRKLETGFSTRGRSVALPSSAFFRITLPNENEDRSAGELVVVTDNSTLTLQTFATEDSEFRHSEGSKVSARTFVFFVDFALYRDIAAANEVRLQLFNERFQLDLEEIGALRNIVKAADSVSKPPRP